MSLTAIIISATYLFGVSHALPPDYCFSRLNKSDCGKAPTPVFTYYLEGSRCEIELWRGCLTSNKFADEIECSDACIGSFNFEMFSSEENEIDDEKLPKNPCHDNLNKITCKEEKNITVFTYDAISANCTEDTWTGCPTLNKFDTEDECKKQCIIEEPFENKMENINVAEAKHINDILDDVQKLDEVELTTQEPITTESSESEEESTESTATVQEAFGE